MTSHMSADEFRRNGHAVIDWIADYYDSLETKPVLARVEPGEIAAKLPECAPRRGEPFADVLADLDEIVMPGITHWQSPSFFAFYPANTSAPSILGDLVSSGLGVQGMLWATSPACTEVEMRVLDWVVDACGLPERFRSDRSGGGVIHDTASTAAVCAIVAARERAGAAVDELVAYASEHAHSSIEKGLRIAGLTRLRSIEAAEDHAMRPAALAAAMAADTAAGLRPFFVNATAGTTSSCAFDPVPEIAAISGQHGAWLHVDAAYAGSAAVCPELRYVNAGVEHADSYCFNAHKWLLTGFDCTCFFVADRGALIRSMSVLPEYLRNAATESGAVIDYRDWQIPLGRRFRSLKLWFVFRHYGLEGLQAYIRNHVECASAFATRVEGSDDFELAAPQQLGLVCFRHRGGDDVNQRILDQVNASGELYLTHTKLDDQLTLRLAIGGARTERRHVERAWSAISAAAG